MAVGRGCIAEWPAQARLEHMQSATAQQGKRGLALTIALSAPCWGKGNHDLQQPHKAFSTVHKNSMEEQSMVLNWIVTGCGYCCKESGAVGANVLS